MTKIAINGFGRIGRSVFKRVLEKYPDLVVVAINDLTDTETLSHLLSYDSIYGRYKNVSHTKKSIKVKGKEYPVSNEKDPAKLPWKKLGVDIVLECTGYFRTSEEAGKHIKAGAKMVILSATGKSESIPSFVLGVNEKEFNESNKIVDMGSCTTNCLAPMAKVLNDSFTIENGFMTTVHSYTNNQKLLDLPHKDLRRARAAAINIVPTSTSSAKAIGKVIPALKGKMNGISLRVPTPAVSIVDLTVNVSRKVTIAEVNNAFKKAEKKGDLKGRLITESKPLVSSDYIGNEHCSIIDLDLTDTNEKMIKVLAWYDNEWGYCCRLAEFANFVASKIK